jgi:hypothetical protein
VQFDQSKFQAGIQLIGEALGGAAPQPAPATDPGRLLSSPELAAAYGVCQRTVTNWRLRGCPCQRISSRAYRYDLAQVQAWHARQGQAPAPQPKKAERNELGLGDDVGENPFADQ